MEDIVIVETKDYAQVIFEDVESSYNENHDLECSFTINELLKPDSTDAVGIFKIGFQVYKDHVCIQTIDVESIKEGKGKVVFSAEDLPKDDGEFYQFIYLSQSKQVRGASIPFQFKKIHISDFVEVEEQEAVIIKSKESVINETINEIKARCIHLTEANEMYEKLVKENEDLIDVLKDEVSTVKLRCLNLTMDNEKLNKTLKSKADNQKNLADTISNLTDENNRLQSKFQDLAVENKNLVDSLQHRIQQIAQLKTDLETVRYSKDQLEAILNIKECELSELRQDKDQLNRIADDLQKINEQIGKLEVQVNDRVEELTKIKHDLKRNETLVSEQSETIQTILNERDNLNQLIQKLTKEKNELENSQENLSQELNMSKDKLLAAEQCKEMLRNQLFVATNELNEANSRIDEYLSKMKHMMNKEKQLELEKSDLMQKMQLMQTEYENRLEQINGSYYALKLAHVHLESRIKGNDNIHEKYLTEIQEQKFTILKLKTENEELKERIEAGANEYKKLFEKFRALRRGQFNHQDISNAINEDLIHLRQPFRNSSTPSGEERSEVDSAFQERTLSQCIRASNTDIENTLLDALLGSSLINQNWGNNTQLQQEQSSNLTDLQHQFSQLATTSTPTLVPTTSQPRAALEDLQANLLNSRSNELNDFKQQNLIASSSMNTIRTRSSSPSSSTGLGSTTVDFDRKVYQLYNKPTSDKTCEICNYMFPTDAKLADFENHYALHYGPSCPICFLTFRKGYPQQEFEAHVNSHFTN